MSGKTKIRPQNINAKLDGGAAASLMVRTNEVMCGPNKMGAATVR